MRLLSQRQCNAVRLEVVVLGVLEVNRCGSSIHVPIGCEVEVAQLGAERSKDDVLEVGVGAIGPFEGRRDQPA